MTYEVLFDDSAIEDLSDILLYEVGVLGSIDQARERVDELMDTLARTLSTFPARFSERTYGYTPVLRRSCPVGSHVALFRIDEAAGAVHIDKIAHAKSDFTRYNIR